MRAYISQLSIREQSESSPPLSLPPSPCPLRQITHFLRWIYLAYSVGPFWWAVFSPAVLYFPPLFQPLLILLSPLLFSSLLSLPFCCSWTPPTLIPVAFRVQFHDSSLLPILHTIWCSYIVAISRLFIYLELDRENRCCCKLPPVFVFLTNLSCLSWSTEI